MSEQQPNYHLLAREAVDELNKLNSKFEAARGIDCEIFTLDETHSRNYTGINKIRESIQTEIGKLLALFDSKQIDDERNLSAQYFFQHLTGSAIENNHPEIDLIGKLVSQSIETGMVTQVALLQFMDRFSGYFGKDAAENIMAESDMKKVIQSMAKFLIDPLNANSLEKIKKMKAPLVVFIPPGLTYEQVNAFACFSTGYNYGSTDQIYSESRLKLHTHYLAPSSDELIIPDGGLIYVIDAERSYESIPNENDLVTTPDSEITTPLPVEAYFMLHSHIANLRKFDSEWKKTSYLNYFDGSFAKGNWDAEYKIYDFNRDLAEANGREIHTEYPDYDLWDPDFEEPEPLEFIYSPEFEKIKMQSDLNHTIVNFEREDENGKKSISA